MSSYLIVLQTTFLLKIVLSYWTIHFWTIVQTSKLFNSHQPVIVYPKWIQTLWNKSVATNFIRLEYEILIDSQESDYTWDGNNKKN